MIKVQIPQNDFGYNEQFTIYTDGRHLTVKDLTGYEAWLYAWGEVNSDTAIIAKKINIADDPTTGIVYWNVEADDTAVFGNFIGEIRLIKYSSDGGQTIVSQTFSTMQFDLQIIATWQDRGE